MKTAVISKPSAESAAAHGASGNAPLKIRNSPTNPFSPGNPSDENSAIPISPQNTGATLRSPPKSFKSAQPAAALLDQPHKPEQRRRGEAVIEHLQHDTVQRRRLVHAALPGAPEVTFTTANKPSRQ